MKKMWIGILFVFFLAAIQFQPDGVMASESAGQQLTYRLKWLFNISVIGDLYADENGYFKAAGLDVTIKEGGPERDAIRELELGYADFGVASADQVIRAVSKGAPVVVIAQLFQANPLQWVYRADRFSIGQIADLKAKTIGITFGGNDETIMRTLLAKGGISEEEIRIYSVRYDYTPFYRRKVDLWPVYVNAQGPIIGQKLERAGEKVAFFDPSAYGVNFVANSVVTSVRMMREHPDTVKQFTQSLLKGWEEALKLENSKAALDMLRKFDKDTPRPILEKQLVMTRKLVKPAEAVGIGAIDIDAWKQTENIMLEQKLIQKPVGVYKVLMQY